MTFWNKKPGSTPETSAPSVNQPSTPIAPIQANKPAVMEGTAPAKKPEPHLGAPKATTNVDPEEMLAERFGKLRSALGQGTVIQGKLSFDTPVRMDGKLSGEVFSSKALIVGPSGLVDAKVEVAALIVMGKVKGNVRAAERIELLAGGCIEGDVETPLFVMEEGATLCGGCKVIREKQKAASESDRAAAAVKPHDKQEKKGEPTAAQRPAATGSNGASASTTVSTEARLH